MRRAGDSAENGAFRGNQESNQIFSTERQLAWGKDAPKLSNYPVDSAQKALGTGFSIVDDGHKERLPRKLRKAIKEYDKGAEHIDDVRSDLKDARNYIYGKDGIVDDKEGRKNLREARRELKEAKEHFRHLAHEVGHGDGAEDIREGRQDLRKADRLIGKALRQDRNFHQNRALESIRKAIDHLDGTDGPSAIEEGLNKAIDTARHDEDSPDRRRRRL